MRTSAHFAAALAVATLAACHSAPPPPPVPPAPLSDSAQSAVRWVDAHATPFTISDSVAPTADEVAKLRALVGDARVIGISEMNETAHEFTTVVRRMLFSLAESDNVRGLAIQAPMPEMMELDRYVRTGVGDPRRLLHALGQWRYETREMQSLVAAIRDWNAAHPEKQIGFYGFEIPTAAHAVEVVTGLRDSVTGPALGAWLRRQYPCVISDEEAHWGLEGRAADSTYWNNCRPAVTVAADSIAALHARLRSTSRAEQLAFVEQMARLIQHHVTIGLLHLPRQDTNAEHVLYLANLIGPNAKLLVWGGDVEMGRLTLPPSTVQTGQSLGTKLSEKYRAIAFMVGDGAVRIRRPSSGRGGAGGGQGSIADVPLRVPVHETLEDILRRGAAGMNAYMLDVHDLPKTDMGATWLRGPRTARLLSELYAPELPELFIVTVEFPKDYDVVLFVRHVTPARQ